MPETATIISIAAIVIAPAAGFGMGFLGHTLAARRFRHEVEVTRWQRIQESYREQIASAENRKDDPEVDRLRQEYEGQLEAWRANQDLESLTPRTISAGTEPTLKPEEVERLRRLLAAAAPLSPGALSAEGHLLRGNALYESGRYEEALAAYDRALALRPDDPTAHMNRGVALEDLGRHEEALAAHDRALALRPDYPNAHMNRGAALGELGRYEEALAASDRALALEPELPEAHNNRGIALRNLGRHEEALTACDRALALRPDFSRGPRQPGGRAEAPGTIRRGAGGNRPGARPAAGRPRYLLSQGPRLQPDGGRRRCPGVAGARHRRGREVPRAGAG